jgi:uncharacterized membrane protein
MNLSKISGTDRIASAAAAIIVVTALLSISSEWGLLMVLSLLAGVGTLAVVFQPQLAPARTLPATKATLLLALGATAAISTTLVAIDWIGWIFKHPTRFDTIQFLVGLAAAIALAVVSYRGFRAERAAPAPAPTSSTTTQTA